jgi:hypothetical protein
MPAIARAAKTLMIASTAGAIVMALEFMGRFWAIWNRESVLFDISSISIAFWMMGTLAV